MKIHQLLAKPEAWTQRAYARNKDGVTTYEDSQTACQWCLIGAVIKCYPGLVNRQQIYDAMGNHIPKTNILSWNDDPSRTHAEVLALVTKLDI